MARSVTSSHGPSPRKPHLLLRVLRGLMVSLIAVVLSVVLGGLLLVGWFLSEHRYVEFIEQELEALLAAEVRIASSTLSFRQGLGVQLKTVSMQEPAGSAPFFRAERVDVLLDMKALLRGRLLFRQLACIKPRVQFHQKEGAETLSSPVARVFARAAAKASAPVPSDTWFSPHMDIQHITLDEGEISFLQSGAEQPFALTQTHMRISFDAQNGVRAHLTADLGQNGIVGQLRLHSHAAQWDRMADSSSIEWQGEVRLQNVAVRTLGKWLGADWPKAQVDFSGNYIGRGNATTAVTGLVTIRQAQSTHLTVSEGKIDITQLSWNNPEDSSAWFVLAPVAGLLQNHAARLASLTVEGDIEQVSARIGERNVPIKLTAGHLHLKDGKLKASKLKGAYGHTSSLTNGSADWQPLFSKRRSALTVQLTADLSLADDLESMLDFLPAAERETFSRVMTHPSGHAAVELSLHLPAQQNGQASYAGSLEWRQAGFLLPEWNLAVSDMNGIVRVAQEKDSLVLMNLEDVRLRIGESVALVEGHLTAPLTAARRGRVTLSIPEASVQDFAHLLPDTEVRPQSGRLSGAVTIRFDPERVMPETQGNLVLDQVRLQLLPFLQPLDVTKGKFVWHGQTGWFVVEEGRLPGGRLTGKGEIARFEPLDMQVTVECTDLDLGPTLILDDQDKKEEEPKEIGEDGDVRVDVRCEHLHYGTFEATQVRAASRWHHRQVDFTVQEAHMTQGQLTGQGTFWLDSDALSFEPQLGQVAVRPFFAALGHPTDTISGTLSGTGEIEIANWEHWDDPEEWDGQLSVNVRDGIARRIPILVRLWSALSLQSIFSFALPQLPRAGLAFSSLSGDLIFEQGNLRTDNLSFIGEAVRLDTRGHSDLRRKTVDFITNVVPLRGITSVVEKVPLAGKLLARGADQLTTLPFQVQGSYADPQVRLRLIKKIMP